MVISSPSAFTSSSTGFISGEQSNLHACLRETEAFIQSYSPRSAPGSIAEVSPFPVNLGGGDTALPATRATSAGKHITFDTLPVDNSGKPVDKMVGLWNTNPTFGGLTISDFASCVAGGEITEGDGLLECNICNQVPILVWLLLMVKL